ncbi:hypothetical protein OSB04_030576 [Centaurea solstitialis]|uniref:Uncharacterized protein n=1 Tax=Centaurea solstitialis TaxID=347529 RepID=A0AA38SFF3_9ASTR|nr:hypothetical protein OSB04_030576 [Centaurea solstitialis]
MESRFKIKIRTTSSSRRRQSVHHKNPLTRIQISISHLQTLGFFDPSHGFRLQFQFHGQFLKNVIRITQNLRYKMLKMDYWTSFWLQIQKALILLKRFNEITSFSSPMTTMYRNKNQVFFKDFFHRWKTKFDFKLQSFVVFLFTQSVIREPDLTEAAMDAIDNVTAKEILLWLYSPFHGVVDSIKCRM